jgi:hypothetical protein
VNSSHTQGTTNPDKKTKNMTKKQKLEKKKTENEFKYGVKTAVSDTSVISAISDTSVAVEGVTSGIEVLEIILIKICMIHSDDLLDYDCVEEIVLLSVRIIVYIFSCCRILKLKKWRSG